MTLVDGVYEDVQDDADQVATALLAGAAPVHPPKAWFDQPKFTGKTPITVTADGQIYGHIAAWDVDHIGLPGQRKPPRSKSGYAFFRTGVLETAEGEDVNVGQLTCAGGHAGLAASSGDAVKHYDDTASAVADVAAGEDQFGIWVAGGLRPGVSAEQIRTLRASAPSGDWRPINGNLELVAVCQVNVPGFPVARGMVAGGEYISLVAAGAAAMYELQQENETLAHLRRLEDRFTVLEDAVGVETVPADDAEEEDVPAITVDVLEQMMAAGAVGTYPPDEPDADDAGSNDMSTSNDKKAAARKKMLKAKFAKAKK